MTDNAVATRLRHTTPPVPSPIGRDELRLQALGERMRLQLLEEIESFLSKPTEDRDAATWLALIKLSMMAYGAALDIALVDSLLPELDDQFRTNGEVMWVDRDTESRLRRTVLDPISAALVYRHVDDRKQSPAIADIRRAENRVLRRLVPTWLGENAQQRRKGFLEAIAAYFRRHMPGFVLSHALGASPGAAVPLTTLVREAGLRLAGKPDARLEQDAPDAAKSGSVRPGSNPYRSLKRVLKAVQASSASGGVSNGTLDQRRQQLDSELQQLAADSEVPGVVGRIVVNWMRSLIEHGPSKPVLETSTLQAYAAPVLAFVCTDVGQAFLSADPEDIEHAFRSQLGRIRSASALKRALLVLRHFHDFAVRSFGVEALDWSVIVEGIPELSARVDANLVFLHEIQRADEIISRAAHLDPDIRQLARLYLWLMWATGARFGECYRLRLCDVSLCISEIVIRPTEHGQVKSAAGQRLLPLDGALDPTGVALLKEAVARAHLIGQGDPLTPLAGVAGDARSLLPRRQISDVVNTALRLVTGDPSVHAHTLRHSRATGLADALLSDISPSQRIAAPEIGRRLLGIAGPSRRSAHAIAQVLGQSSPDIAQLTYIHQAELRVYRIAVRLLPVLSVAQLAALLGKPRAWVYKRTSTAPIQLLGEQLRQRAQEMPDRDFKAGVEVTTTAPELPVTVGTRGDRISLLQIHYLHRICTQAELPISVLATAFNVSEGRMQRLTKALTAQAIRLGYVRGGRSLQAPWKGGAAQFSGVRRAPNGFVESEIVQRIEDMKVAPELRYAAESIMHKLRRNTGHITLRNLTELDHALRWLAACGVLATHIGIRCPFAERATSDSNGISPVLMKDESPIVRAACSAFPDVEITDKPISARRAVAAEIHFFDEREWTVAELAHATFLWLVRAAA